MMFVTIAALCFGVVGFLFAIDAKRRIDGVLSILERRKPLPPSGPPAPDPLIPRVEALEEAVDRLEENEEEREW